MLDAVLFPVRVGWWRRSRRTGTGADGSGGSDPRGLGLSYKILLMVRESRNKFGGFEDHFGKGRFSWPIARFQQAGLGARDVPGNPADGGRRVKQRSPGGAGSYRIWIWDGGRDRRAEPAPTASGRFPLLRGSFMASESQILMLERAQTCSDPDAMLDSGCCSTRKSKSPARPVQSAQAALSE